MKQRTENILFGIFIAIFIIVFVFTCYATYKYPSATKKDIEEIEQRIDSLINAIRIEDLEIAE